MRFSIHLTIKFELILSIILKVCVCVSESILSASYYATKCDPLRALNNSTIPSMCCEHFCIANFKREKRNHNHKIYETREKKTYSKLLTRKNHMFIACFCFIQRFGAHTFENEQFFSRQFEHLLNISDPHFNT